MNLVSDKREMCMKTNQYGNLTVKYSFVQCFLWTSYAAIVGFASVYLLNVGFTNMQIGIITAAAGAISAILQPVVATFADNPDSPSLKIIILLTDGIMLVLAVLLVFLHGAVLLTGLFYGACVTVLFLLTPLINSLSMESVNQGYSLNFGAARGIGSLAYAAASYVLGILSVSVGTVIIPVSIAVLSTGMVLALLNFPFQKTIHSTAKKQENKTLLSFVKHYRKFMAALFGYILIYMGHAVINTYAFQIIESKGGNSQALGIAMAVCAAVELPAMFLFGKMLKIKESSFWFRLAAVFMTLKVAGTLIAPGMGTFFAVQILQMLGWGLICVASVYYVNSVMEESDAIKGQAYMTMTYSIGNVLGSLIGGSFLDYTDVTCLLAVTTLLSTLGMVIVLLAVGKGQKKRDF